MKKLLTGLGAIGCATLGSAEAEAANCPSGISFSVSPAIPQISGWDPLNATQGTASFTVQLSRAAGTSGVASARFILLDTDNTAAPLRIKAPQGEAVVGPVYSITSGSATVAQPSSYTGALTAAPLFVFGSGPGSSTPAAAIYNITLSANTSQDYNGNATYSEQLGYILECYSNSSGGGTTSRTISSSGGSGLTLAQTIPLALKVTTGTSYDLAFGMFQAGQSATQTASIKMRSTSRIKVDVATSFGSSLVLNGASTTASERRIPYTMTLASQPLQDNSSVTLARAGFVDQTIPLGLNVAAGAAANKVAGDYSGTVTLTVTAVQ